MRVERGNAKRKTKITMLFEESEETYPMESDKQTHTHTHTHARTHIHSTSKP